MQYLIAGGLLGAAAFVGAAPQAPRNSSSSSASLASGTSYRLQFCTNNNFEGDCEEAFADATECVDVGSIGGKISSFQVSRGASCYLYGKKSCTGDRSEVVKSSIENLKSIDFNDKAQSFRCWSGSQGSVSVVSQPPSAIVTAVPDTSDAPTGDASGPTCLEIDMNEPGKNYPFWKHAYCNHTEQCLSVPEASVNNKITIWSNNAIHCDSFSDVDGACKGNVSQTLSLTPYQQGQIDAKNPVRSFKCYNWNSSVVAASTISVVQPSPVSTVTLVPVEPFDIIPPAPQTDDEGNMCALLCRDKDLKNKAKGDCETLCNTADKCVNELPDNLNKKVSSVHSDPSLECYLYKETYCRGDRSQAFSGVVKNLKDISFNDKAQSFQCFEPKGATCPDNSTNPEEPELKYCAEACRVDDDSEDCFKTCFTPNDSEQPRCVDELPKQISGKVTTFDFDGDGLTCHLWSDKKCKGSQSRALTKDCRNLRAIGFEDKAKSFQCFKRTDSDKAAVLRKLLAAKAPVTPALHSRDAAFLNMTAMKDHNYCISIYKDVSFEGNSEQYCAKRGTCHSLPSPMSGDIMSANASSASACYLYEDTNCSEDQARSPKIDYHGISDLSTTQSIHGDKVDFSEMAKAFKCWPDEAGHHERGRSTGETDHTAPGDAEVPPPTTNACVELFSKTDFDGESKTMCADFEDEKCTNIKDISESWNDKAKSAFAYPGFTCALYKKEDCGGSSTRFFSIGGIQDLDEVQPKLGKEVSSFRCHRDTMDNQTWTTSDERRSTTDVDTPLPALAPGNTSAGCIFMYKDTDFLGELKKACADELGECFDDLEKRGFDDKAKSVRASSGFACQLFEDKKCKGKSTKSVGADGIQDLSQIKPNLFKEVSSFRCHHDSQHEDVIIDAEDMLPTEISSYIEEMPATAFPAEATFVPMPLERRNPEETESTHPADCK
ncbi:Hypothetical predicted protein [Lecanosticta acicola]|uniref:Uncharacterized protein n=1 Tax=Lecanosticta acicola TaxID=111012 RepID=A0AAI8YYG6_9PEZI|nr:Hypothetical predicted protein [Lecanosticta acicola]